MAFSLAAVFCVAASAFAEGNIDDYYFRYDFTKGVKTYKNNGCETEPCTSSAGYTGVYGVTGYNNAVHPRGWGSISNGDALMNADWSVAMSVKSCDVENGVLLCLGGNGVINNKQILFCSSSTPGTLHVVTGSITGAGTAQMLTMAEGAVFKPNGEGYLTVTEVLEGQMTIDTGDLNMNSRKVPLPLFKVASAEMLPAKDDIAFSGGKVPKGWKLYPLKDEFGYELKRVGFALLFR